MNYDAEISRSKDWAKPVTLDIHSRHETELAGWNSDCSLQVCFHCTSELESGEQKASCDRPDVRIGD